eukprot:m.266172 g.266172  ORF g.266172 m.266172 type:complete len:658 (+) comp65721_c0_seq1:243-2216(+)
MSMSRCSCLVFYLSSWLLIPSIWGDLGEHPDHWKNTVSYADTIPNEPLIFTGTVTTEDIILHGKDVPEATYITTHVNYGPQCSHGGQYWINMSVSKFNGQFECVFGLNPVLYRTKVHSITQQTFRCAHPPAHIREDLIGVPLSLEVTHSFIVPSVVKYEGMPRPNILQGNRKKPYFMCSCMIMWNRTEFLLEWLRYHALMHGLGKMFLYDNGSGDDYLHDTVRMLNSMLPAEIVDWPWYPTQPAYLGHCVHKATAECEWVTFFDVDEFIYTNKATGRFDLTLQQYSKMHKDLGGLEIQLLTMGPHPKARWIESPAGGVVRNYVNQGRVSNVKTVLRTDTVHPSLFGGIHFFCYKKLFRKFTMKPEDRNLVLYHYKIQAWNVFKMKYLRRASPASLPFTAIISKANSVHPAKTARPQNLSLPSERYYKEVKANPFVDRRLSQQALCSLSLKKIDAGFNCTSETTARLLVTGSGGLGSGMGWLWKQLSLKMSTQDREVAVDWTRAMIRPPLKSTNNPHPHVRFDFIYHQVREPIAAIEAITSFDEADWKHVKKVSNFDSSKYDNSVLCAMHFWVIWNQLIEMVSDWRFQIEHVDLNALCSKANLSSDCSSFNDVQKTPYFYKSTRSVLGLSWGVLLELDRNITLVAQTMARRYGYTVET